MDGNAQRLAAEPAAVKTTPETAAGTAPGEAAAEPAAAGNAPDEPVPPPIVPTQAGPAQPPTAAAPPVKGFSLLLSILWERIRAVLRRR